MSRRSRGDILFALALLLMIGGGSAFVWVETAPVPPQPQPYQAGSQGSSNWFNMVPLTIRTAPATRTTTPPATATTRSANDIAAARAAWDDFINHVGADEASVRLAGRLYGGLPTELARIDPAAAQGGAAAYLAPSAGRSVALRIASLAVETTRAQPRATPPLLHPFVSITVMITIPDRRQTIGGVNYSPGGGVQTSLDEVLSILADDYFLRHGLSWTLRYNNDLTPRAYNDATAMRAELDKRIRKVADDAEQLYGGFKPR